MALGRIDDRIRELAKAVGWEVRFFGPVGACIPRVPCEKEGLPD